MTRPNILLITSDQQRGDCYGFEGRAVKTPHLDTMAAGGTRFSACITPNAVCQPSRASILTGLLPLNHGVHDNGIDLDEDLGRKGFAGALSASGYSTGFIGKAHFATYHTHAPTGSPECSSSSADYDETWFGPYHGFEHVELIHIGHNWWMPAKPPHGQHYERFFHRDGRGEKLFELYQKQLAPQTDAAQTWHSALPQSVHNSNWVADRTIEYMKDKKDEGPFCVWASFPDPHHPFDAPEPWSRLHDPDEVDLPEHRTRDFDRRPFWHRAAVENRPSGSAESAEIRTSYSRIPPQSDRQLRDLIANYYGQISLIDHNVGRIMESLEEQGLAENTIVIYTTDHGDWLGDHGLILKGPMMYDGLLRIGLIAQGPGVPAGKVVRDPVSTLDLGASFCDWAGASPLIDQHGTSLRPLIEGDASRDFAFNEWWLLPTRAGVELKLETVRTERYRMSVDRLSGEGELYDFREDPHEMDNRFNDPALAAVQKELDDMARSRPTGAQTEPGTQVGMA